MERYDYIYERQPGEPFSKPVGMAENAHGNWVKYADAQATVEALQRELLEWKRALCNLTPGGSEFADDHAYCTEWVRKARENQHDIIISKHRELKATQTALDAEREKVKGLEREAERLRIVNRGHINEGFKDMKTIEELTAAFAKAQTDLSKLQALVRALPKLDFVETVYAHESGVNSYMVGGLQVRFKYKADRDAYVELLRYRATLDATTLAKGGDGE